MSHSTTAIPTFALSPSAIPSSHEEISHPFFRFEGYGAVGTERITEIMHRAQEEGLDALSTFELRVEYLRTCRAQRHGGGPYGPDDPQDRHKNVILNLVHDRVCARDGAVGLWRGDITALHIDVIVNAANRALSGGGGVDGAIQKAAGPDLLKATLAMPEITSGVRCPVGGAVLTPGFKLPARHVVHAVGPVWEGGESGEPELLASTYRASLDLASGVGAEAIAFPAISTGAYGYPSWEAAKVAVRACHEWRTENESAMRIVLVAFDDKSQKHLRAALNRIVRT